VYYAAGCILYVECTQANRPSRAHQTATRPTRCPTLDPLSTSTHPSHIPNPDSFSTHPFTAASQGGSDRRPFVSGDAGNGGEGLRRRPWWFWSAHVLSIPPLRGTPVGSLRLHQAKQIGGEAELARCWGDALLGRVSRGGKGVASARRASVSIPTHHTIFCSRVLMDVLGPRVSKFSVEFLVQFRVMVALSLCLAHRRGRPIFCRPTLSAWPFTELCF
jgi:hypothetical protein